MDALPQNSGVQARNGNGSGRKPTTREVDAHVGVRIRERRVLLGLTQLELADLIGVTYQQAHKYERGINRVSAGRLYDISQALQVSVGFFFEGLEESDERPVTQRQRMCLELARNFSMIANERHQQALSSLARALVEK
ncbi:MAG: helix-turn-helix transcriptional regulator [Alphaproteobacteria bacterium]|jgi:transcriptional regulator with XRE-family HTH domain|nr:transcriptional regulator [Rhodospirillaceae bacterium]MDP6407456.1 helix-turn-helix transcriptional regulator [Alphaproteobacteria bacterium]MDP6623746.1 helix-turn-helix transcriptional regulator [Alphaproteobacteria bacterium]HJP21724.1 helix-turn-helix transcriptional regulator [Alphaproteobacteria bacterium]|tara:strand:+ start:554 stop:967 length:414 start_codon:yes stop_codon:yes gene_type:complete